MLWWRHLVLASVIEEEAEEEEEEEEEAENAQFQCLCFVFGTLRRQQYAYTSFLGVVLSSLCVPKTTRVQVSAPC
ncbi:hypothetical protein EYF80_027888 [Liparis tanakae]|uniref:Uncharacterized protein n=1 Tax=Liparis tanakae TaxID=230148 RepID=A0A4Z2HAQ5_9TELE|nr:hypothetical protein EYF80_027888 [Liparis tanakae]